jgi:integrase/recombinase XerD
MLERYAHHLRMANYSPRTIQEYRKIIGLWFRASGNRTMDVSPDELDAWVDQMYEKNLKPGTIATRITAIRAFFGWCVEQQALVFNPAAGLPKVRLGKRLPKAATHEEVRRFFQAIKMQPGSRSTRDWVLFTILYAGGLRVSEVVGLRVEDFDPEYGIMQIRGKGNRERTIHLRDSDVALLRTWIGERERGWMFPGQGEGHLSARVVQQYCREYQQAAGIQRRVTPHTFRHSCAVHSLTSGAPITYVQQRLGHANLATTGIYTQLADEERARITRQVELAI